jgi:hypothetical protein
MVATKHDNGKPRMDLLDQHALHEISRVLGYGTQKYAAHDWRQGLQYSRLIGAALRHLHAFNDGEDKDSESGLSHVAHAGCCIMFLLWMEQNRKDLDDRWTTLERIKEYEEAEANARASNDYYELPEI